MPVAVDSMRHLTRAHVGARALSDSTIRQTYTVLRAGLDGAVRDGLIARNPAALIKRPGVERREARHLAQSARQEAKLAKAKVG